MSREAQRKQNAKNAEKRLVRLINANFTRGDVMITLTYRKELRPDSYKDALKDVQNYLRRVKNWRKRSGMTEGKYLYVIERSGKDNWHAHLIMSKMSRDIAESLWKHADFVNAKSYQPTEQDGGAAFANYILGNKGGKPRSNHGWRRWNCSKNLTKPTEQTEDGTHTRRQIACIVREHIDDKEYWERKYSGFRFVSATPAYNEYNGWWYLYVRMYRAESYAAANNRKIKSGGCANDKRRISGKNQKGRNTLL